MNYIVEIWNARFFWMHLAFSDLRSRWRNSFFGIIWSLLQPLGLTILLSLVFSKMFHMDILKYAPYILSGIIVWDFLMACVTGGAMSFIQSDAYIKQTKHPLAIYTLRCVISNGIVLIISSLPLYVWTLIVLPEKFGFSWVASLFIFPILFFIAWPISTLLAYICVQFRDIPNIMALGMQALWFVSPVYFDVKIFRNGGLDVLIDNNPIFHLLQIFRAPLLSGEWPSLENYIYVICLILMLTFFAICVGVETEKRVIFYL